MATEIQYRRGSGVQNDAFTGALGEITVDTTQKTLRVHDGSTVGGMPLVSSTYTGNVVITGSITASSFVGVDSTAITNGTSNVSVISSGGNVNINVGGTLEGTFHSGGLNVTALQIADTAVTATASELNILDGVTATTTELNYVDGVTSAIQTQLNAKQATITGAATTIDTEDLTASRALVSDGSGKVAVSDVTSTEVGYLDGVTSAIQTQLNAKAALASPSFTTKITTPVVEKSGTNGVGDIGQTDNRFGTVYGLATSAQYADLAEVYRTDQEYEAGTVVVFGGEAEVMASHAPHDRRVAGVISTAPAHKMNADAEGQAIALTGRVPCKVKGPIDRGDLVVTSNLVGVGQKLNDAQYLPGMVLGKALESIEDDQVHTIEVVVGRL